MSKDKERDNIKDKTSDTLNIYDIGSIKEKIIYYADSMYRDLGHIDTKTIYKRVILDDNPLFDIENFTEFDLKKTYIDILDDIITKLTDLSKQDVKKLAVEDIKSNINYLNLEINNYSNNLLLDNCIDRALSLASKFSDAITDIQIQEIKDTIGIDAFYQIKDFKKLPFKAYVSNNVLYTAIKLVDAKELTDEIYKIKTKDELLKLDLYASQQIETNRFIDEYINQPKFIDLYDKVQKKYDTINKLFDKVFKMYDIKGVEVGKHKIVKQPKAKSFDLHLAKMFNNTYLFNKYTSIDKNGNGKYDIQLNIVADSVDDFKELRDVIFVDEYNKQQLTLLPIDLALFVAFTSINSANGNNTPIALTDAFRFMSEDAKVRVRKGEKGYNTYVAKMRAFSTFKAKSVIKDRATNEELIKFNDAIPILENYEVVVGGKEVKYVIGASAILTILNWLSEKANIDYRATYNVANQYINDNQNNTIEILNMKYYLLIKALQIKNRADKNAVVNPKISLNELYNQTALLKDKKELNKTERKRLRDSANIFLEHLKSKDLIKEYSYTPIGKSKTSNALTSTKKDDLYIKA